MQVRDVETGFVIRLSRGEKVMETLAAFCATRGIQSGFFHALGAVERTALGYYDLGKRAYFFKDIPEIREVASMSGNIALVDGTPFIHAHAVLSATELSLQCLGGHVKEATVAVTLEVHLTPFNTPLSRQYDEETGLKLLSL
jgi:predicted DNA-binding protein with PD1-like motif